MKKTIKKKVILTNGGKPHICGEIAIHNTGLKDDLLLCPNCLLPVDTAKV